MSGKTYRLESDRNLVRIVWEGGGQIPKQLKGLWPSHNAAKREIALYEANVKRKPAAKGKTRKVKNGSTEDNSRTA